MAIYHLRIQIIGRSAGRSAVAAASYRSGDILTNDYDGVTHDFSQKYNVMYSEIMLPDNAPSEYKDRSTLWNSVEVVEKSSKAQLAREIEVSLPQGLTLQQQIDIAHEYCQENFVDHGMCVDFSIHNPPIMKHGHPVDAEGHPTKDPEKMIFDHNPHIHIMLTMRSMDTEGKWEGKTSQVYICVRDTGNGREEKALTAAELKEHKDEGWEKQYQYYEGRHKTWHTQAEARERDLKQVNKYPKRDTIQNSKLEYWNNKDRIYEWREDWANVVNRTLESIGRTDTIDHRSYADQGSAKIPMIYMGQGSLKYENEGIRTELGDINRQISAHNRFVDLLKNMVDSVIDRISSLYERTAHMMESIRAQIVGTDYRLQHLQTQRDLLSGKLNNGNYEYKVNTAYEQMISSNKTIKEYTAEKKDIQTELKRLSPIKFMKREELNDRLSDVENRIETETEYKAMIYQGCGFTTDTEVKTEHRNLNNMISLKEKIDARIAILSKGQDKSVNDYAAHFNKIPDNDKGRVDDTCSQIRPDYINVLLADLRKEFGDRFNETVFASAQERTDRLLAYADRTIQAVEKDSIYNIRETLGNSNGLKR